jgi:hypothetical protein
LKVNNGGQICGQEPWKTVGEEGPFYRVRKLLVTEFPGCFRAELGVAPDYTSNQPTEYNATAQPGAEPIAILDCTLDFQNSKNAISFASKLLFLANLGFSKS